MTGGDVDGLVALYRGLAEADCYRRFFSVHPPGRGFLEEAVGRVEIEGFGLVAVTGDVDGAGGTVVGEASYTPLPDGDGELGITVADEWRGGLGRILLDALLAAAAARGVPNLEADVLTTNRRMLELARSRGYATMEHPDLQVVRIVIATTGRVPTWPGRHDAPRVLVEVPGGGWPGDSQARAAGLQVLACPGPTAIPGGCPALEGEACPLAGGADVIVLVRPPDEEGWRALPGAHAKLHPGVPVCVEPRPTGAGGGRALVGLISRLAMAHRAPAGP